MTKFKVGEIAIVISKVRPRAFCEIKSIEHVIGGMQTYLIEVYNQPSRDNDGLWWASEKFLIKIPKDDDDKVLTTWQHIEDTIGFKPKIKQPEKANG